MKSLCGLASHVLVEHVNDSKKTTNEKVRSKALVDVMRFAKK